MPEETEPTPIPVWTPILDLLKSRSFITAVCGALFASLVVLVPALAEYEATLIPVIVTLVLALIGADTAETINAERMAARKREADADIEASRAQVEVARIHAASANRLGG